eukprot:5709169-Pleurochrysis_carterae.AAC.1
MACACSSQAAKAAKAARAAEVEAIAAGAGALKLTKEQLRFKQQIRRSLAFKQARADSCASSRTAARARHRGPGGFCAAIPTCVGLLLREASDHYFGASHQTLLVRDAETTTFWRRSASRRAALSPVRRIPRRTADELPRSSRLAPLPPLLRHVSGLVCAPILLWLNTAAVLRRAAR